MAANRGRPNNPDWFHNLRADPTACVEIGNRAVRVEAAFWTANVSQAALFAAWHIVWPVKSVQTGDGSAGEIMLQAGSLMLGTFVAGLV